MRDIGLDRMEEIIREEFKQFVEPFAETMMTGEVPSIILDIHREGTKDSDWLAKLKFRNSDAVSVCHYEVYLEDLMRFCRKCKMYLVTEEITRIVSLYFMIHPLYQNEWIEGKDLGDYESMMLSSSKKTCKFIRRYVKLSDAEKDVLQILEYHMMVTTNRSYVEKDPVARYQELVKDHQKKMLRTRKDQYMMAKRFKSYTCLVNRDGLIVMEYKGGTPNGRKERKKSSGNRNSETG